MFDGINLTAIIIANLMGIVIIFTVAITYNWRLDRKAADTKALLVLVVASTLSCIVDPICFLADGQPGMLNYLLVLIGNTLLYVTNVTCAIAWVLFICYHLGVNLKKWHLWTLAGIYAALMVLLVINFFVPIVFTISEVGGNPNTYGRTAMYWVYLVAQFGLLLSALPIYFYAQAKSAHLRMFPVWAFILPVLIGATIQTVFYGVSTIAPFIAVSLGCVTSSLQKELLFRDKLTGLYNRFYLNLMENKIKEKRQSTFTMIMLDINRFKSINDSYGHLAGDNALVETAHILNKVVAESGAVIRYAGDEFIIILNLQDEQETSLRIAKIHEALASYNKTSGKPYEITVSLGYDRFNFNEKTMDEILGIIDKRMYENKQAYYERMGQPTER